MEYKFEDEDSPYSRDDAYEDLEKIRELLHNTRKQIKRDKLDQSDIDLSINIESKYTKK